MVSNWLRNGKQEVKRTGVVGHKSLSTKRFVVESLSDTETSIFKPLLTYHFLIKLNTATALKTYWSFDDRLKISVRHVAIPLMCVGLYIRCLLVRQLISIRHSFTTTM